MSTRDDLIKASKLFILQWSFPLSTANEMKFLILMVVPTHALCIVFLQPLKPALSPGSCSWDILSSDFSYFPSNPFIPLPRSSLLIGRNEHLFDTTTWGSSTSVKIPFCICIWNLLSLSPLSCNDMSLSDASD